MQSRIFFHALIFILISNLLHQSLLAQRPNPASKNILVQASSMPIPDLIEEAISEFEVKLNQKLVPLIQYPAKFRSHRDTYFVPDLRSTFVDVHFELVDLSGVERPSVEVVVPGFQNLIFEIALGNFELSKELLFNMIFGIFLDRIPKHEINRVVPIQQHIQLSEFLNISNVFGYHNLWRSTSGKRMSELSNAVNYFNKSYRTNYRVYGQNPISFNLLNAEPLHYANIFRMYQRDPSSSEVDYPMVLALILSDESKDKNSRDKRYFKLFIPLSEESYNSLGSIELSKILLFYMLRDLKYSAYSSDVPLIPDPMENYCRNIFGVRNGSQP